MLYLTQLRMAWDRAWASAVPSRLAKSTRSIWLMRLLWANCRALARALETVA